ncbi:MAG: phytoene desaturase family protein [Cyclobacteriaceae bacterium]
MSKNKKIAIMGAGISGLSAGVFARMNGFEATIYEMGPKAGGVCSSWERQSYYVNGSIHWLVGSAPGTDLYDLWHQLGVIESNTFYNHNSFIEYKDLNGKEVHFYTNIHKLKKHFLDLSPEDEKPISEFVNAIEAVASNSFPLDKAFDLLNVWDWTKALLSNLPFVLAMGKYNQLSIKEFAQKFKSETLRKAFVHFWAADMSMTFFLMQLAYAYKGTAGYPLGGSGKFIEKLEKRFFDLGGNIEFGNKVTKILIKNHQVVGLEINQKKTVEADYIVSAADGHTVLFELLRKEYVDEKTQTAYQTLKTFPSLIYFSAGIDRTFDEVPPSIVGVNIPLKQALRVGNYIHDRITFQIYNFDPTLAPQGKTLITAMVDTDYACWKTLYEQGQEIYRKERQKISDALIDALEAQFGNIKNKVDFTDTATPITYKNWTGNHNGSYEGWLPTPEAFKLKLPTHLKGLSNFYMCGHWVTPGGGMPPAAYSGRDAIQLICRDEKIHFKTSEL